MIMVAICRLHGFWEFVKICGLWVERESVGVPFPGYDLDTDEGTWMFVTVEAAREDFSVTIPPEALRIARRKAKEKT